MSSEVIQLRPSHHALPTPKTLGEAFCRVLDTWPGLSVEERAALAIELEYAAKDMLANKFQPKYLNEEIVRVLWTEIFPSLKEGA